MKKSGAAIIYSILIISFLIVSIFYRDFSVDDAYIVLRYAENFARNGELVFNAGEKFCAFTSPFHVLLTASIFRLTDNALFYYKILSFCLLIVSGLMILKQFHDIYTKTLIVLIVFFSPCIILWTFGGLETPLLLFSITSLTILSTTKKFNLVRLLSIGFFVGLALITRYDSAPFVLPLLLWILLAARTDKKTNLAICFLMALLVPLTWLLISYQYYGDFLPSSFYAKTPSLKTSFLFYNAFYVFQYFFFVPFLPFLLFFLFSTQPAKRKLFFEQLKTACLKFWGISLGFLCFLFYSFTMATHHMMFAFRIWVPFLPALAMFLSLVLSETKNLWKNRCNIEKNFFRFCFILFSFQIFFFFYIYNCSVDSLSINDDFKGMGIKHIIDSNRKAFCAAKDIEKHWMQFGIPSEKPIIMTWGEGIIPFTLKNAYCYGTLIWKTKSERNKTRPYDYYVLVAYNEDEEFKIKGYKNIASYIFTTHNGATYILYILSRERERGSGLDGLLSNSF